MRGQVLLATYTRGGYTTSGREFHLWVWWNYYRTAADNKHPRREHRHRVFKDFEYDVDERKLYSETEPDMLAARMICFKSKGGYSGEDQA